jgi:dolichol-phosphate mannosyltransferase
MPSADHLAPAADAPAPQGAPGRTEAPAPLPLPLALSVVIPVRNEAPNIAPLVAEIEAALAGIPHEIVYVDDGSSDGTPAALRAAAAGAPVRVLRHRASCGQSAAVVSGVRAARGTWIATLDGDGQNDPADIPRMLARAEAEGGQILVAGHRVTRRDSWVKRRSSRIANGVRAWLLRDATPDTGCGLKVFPRALFLDLPAFDHMHRFLPALVLRQGGRVVSEPVNHRPRVRGTSNYGTLDRLAVSLFDLIGVAWLQRRWKRPQLEAPGLEPRE